MKHYVRPPRPPRTPPSLADWPTVVPGSFAALCAEFVEVRAMLRQCDPQPRPERFCRTAILADCRLRMTRLALTAGEVTEVLQVLAGVALGCRGGGCRCGMEG
jgi:hypothetical protein